MRLLKILFLLLLFLSFASCQTLVKTYMGISNPKMEVESNKRLKYYQPLYEGKEHETQILTVTNQDAYIKTFQTVSSIPEIYLHNRVTDSLYVLDCFEDLKYDVEDFNNGLWHELSKPERKSYDAAKNIIKEAVQVYSVNKDVQKGEWDVYMMYGTFMGKKLRNRLVPLTTLNGLNKMVILDVSVDKREE